MDTAKLQEKLEKLERAAEEYSEENTTLEQNQKYTQAKLEARGIVTVVPHRDRKL